MYSRGRSKDVSPVALARQASEERRRNSTSIMAHYPLPTDPQSLSPFFLPATSSSPSPPASSFTLTPPDSTPLPSHPRTCIIHIDDSYAPINPHKSSSAHGIKLEPLPHSVQPHLSFSLPSDPLGGKPVSRVKGAQRERDRARAKCRYETLARAEQVFATVLARSRRERLSTVVLRTHKKDERKERERVTPEHERPERERDHRRPHADRPSCRVLTHATHPTPVSQQRPATDRFTYAFPVSPTSSLPNSAPARQQQGGLKSRLGLSTMSNAKATNTRSVSFDDVRASMGGVLFPTASGDSATSKTRRESELLGTLLEAVRWEEGERWQQRVRVKASTLLLPELTFECGACASAPLPLDGLSLSALSLPSGGFVSTSASTASRPVSWLSFGSRKSTPSITTAQTTPLSAIKELPPFTDRHTPQRSCGCGRGQNLMAVDVNDTPLGSTVEPSPTPTPSMTSVNTYHGPSQRARKTNPSMRTWLASSVTSMLSAASRLQQVYITATMATFVSTDYYPHGQMLEVSSAVGAPSEYSTRPPYGWRAQHDDVAKFISGTLSANQVTVPYLVFHLLELERIHRSHPPVANSPINGQAQNSTSISTSTPAAADRHIFNANRVHLLSLAQINSWRLQGAPGVTPTRPFYRPELFYRIESGGGSSRDVRGGSPLKWGWQVVWDAEGNVG